MSTMPTLHPVYKSINRPLTILGAERRLFFGAVVIGAATFNLLSTFLGGLLMFGVLFVLARWTTRTDPQLLRILFNASRFKPHYDPVAYQPYRVTKVVSHEEH